MLGSRIPNLGRGDDCGVDAGVTEGSAGGVDGDDDEEEEDAKEEIVVNGEDGINFLPEVKTW